MELNDIAIDADRFEQGAWVDHIPEMGDLRLKVRGVGNADYRKLQARLIDALPRAKKQGGKIEPDELDRITATCLLETVLLDWDGIMINGKSAPYSKEQAKELLLNPKWRRFRDAVAWAASIVADEGALGIEEDAKN